MRVLVIGATGHIGTYLVPRLVRAGHEVLALARWQRSPYQADPAWESVERVVADRDAEDAAGTFGARVAALTPDAVVDLTCFTPESAEQLVEALRDRVQLLAHCGTIWVHGHLREVPVREDAPLAPFGEYGIQKAAIEALLFSPAAAGVPSTVLRAGHISGPGWDVINPAGNLERSVWTALATGATVHLPENGLQTLHHVHADDVAAAFEAAVAHPEAAAGHAFHVTSERALTFRGFAEAVAGWFGRSAQLEILGWDHFVAAVGKEAADVTHDHWAHSPSADVSLARERLGHSPRYTSLEAVADALRWQITENSLDVGGAGTSGLPTVARV
jgi:nucleoside-diphosphate-sugar epimerase